jgi:hypothetical protein
LKTPQEYLIDSFNEYANDIPKNRGEFGKMFAPSNERMSIDLINETTNLRLISRKQLNDILSVEEQKILGFTKGNNDSGSDSLDTISGLRIQHKIRTATFHLEQTRRHSKKNVQNSSTGHTAYSANEFDVVTFTSLKEGVVSLSCVDDFAFSAIPVTELIDKNKKNALVTNVSSTIRKRYEGVAAETLNRLQEIAISQLTEEKKQVLGKVNLILRSNE